MSLGQGPLHHSESLKAEEEIIIEKMNKTEYIYPFSYGDTFQDPT